MQGKGDVGKSRTIRKTYDFLKSRHPNINEEYKSLGEIDIRIILIINGIKIGIESQGDPGGRLEKSLDIFVKEQCIIIICSTRTYGKTVKAIEKLRPNYKLFGLKQDVRSNSLEFDASNEAMAKRIVEEVEKIIGTCQSM